MEYQLPPDYDENTPYEEPTPEEPETPPADKTDELIDFYQGLKEDERKAIESFVNANKDSNLKTFDLQQALNHFRYEKSKKIANENPVVEQLKAATSIKDKEKILKSAGLYEDGRWTASKRQRVWDRLKKARDFRESDSVEKSRMCGDLNEKVKGKSFAEKFEILRESGAID